MPTLSLFRLVAASLLLFFVSCVKKTPNRVPEVNAGADIVIDLPQDSVQLKGTVNDPDDKVVTFLWTKISGEGSPNIDNPGALTTWVRNLKSGDYQFRLTATDGHGATSADTVLITVNPPDEEVVSINPANNVTEVHLFGSDEIDQTDRTAPELLGGSGTYDGTPVDIRAILKFDLTNIPQDAVISSAVLTLYSNPTPLNGHNGVANSGSDNSLFIRMVAEDWDPYTINWLNQPATTTEKQISVPHTNEDFEDLILNVTEMVQAMVSGNSNHGFLMRLQNESPFNFRIFCSSKYANAAKHPKLVISYH